MPVTRRACAANVETAVVQNTKFDARQDEIKEGRASSPCGNAAWLSLNLRTPG